MIFFCEINKTGQEHIMVNSCLLNMLSKNFESEIINVWIDESHFKHYLNKPANIKTRYKKVIQPEKSNTKLWMLKLISEIFMITQILCSARINKVKLVFFSSLSPVGNLYYSLIARMISKVKVIIVMHGELQVAKPVHKKKKVENLYGKALRFCFKRNIRSRKFFILGESIYNNILKYDLLSPEQMICIEHPYVFPERIKDKPVAIKKPILFGHLGVAKLNKQSQLFFQLAESMKDYVTNGLVRFVVVGQILEEIMPFVNSYVSYDKTTDFISRDDYDRKGMELDYSMFFYDEESYEFISSGAIMDAIAYEKPVIGFKITSFEVVFNAHTCTPGYLFDNFEVMSNTMRKIIDEHELNYEKMVCCMSLKKELFSIDAQFPSFKRQIDQFLIS